MTTHPLSTQHDNSVCPHCGCLDLRQYEDEAVICPHCGAVLAEAPPAPAGWLQQWPPQKRSALAQLFYTAVRKGIASPPAIIDVVMADIHRRLQWTADFDQRMWWGQVLNTLHDDPHAAQSYAEEVLAIEQLPAAAKARLKEQKAQAYVLESMRGKPATDKQRWFLRNKGYAGELPTDRAEASELIDRLLHEGGTL